jgi:hypothetical protein
MEAVVFLTLQKWSVKKTCTIARMGELTIVYEFAGSEFGGVNSGDRVNFRSLPC